MPGAVHSSASVGVDSAGFLAWLALVRKAWRGERTVITTDDAARTLGHASAEARRCRTQERKDALNAQLRAECDAGLVCGMPRA